MYLVHGGQTRAWVINLIRAFFDEVHQIVCKKNKSARISKAANFSGKGAATGLAVWLGHTLGFSEPFAIAGATVVILVIAEASRGAFCTMTKKELLAKLQK